MTWLWFDRHMSLRAKIGWTVLYAMLLVLGLAAVGYEFYLAWISRA